MHTFSLLKVNSQARPWLVKVKRSPPPIRRPSGMSYVTCSEIMLIHLLFRWGNTVRNGIFRNNDHKEDRAPLVNLQGRLEGENEDRRLGQG